jgi:PAS domain S-box-containing protein
MPRLISENHIFKITFLRNILIVFLSMAAALSIYNVFFIYPSFTNLVIENTKNDATRAAKYLASILIPEKNKLDKVSLREDSLAKIQEIIAVFELNKLKVFSNEGEVIYSTDADDIGQVNQKKYFNEIVAKGKIHAEVVKKDTQSLEDQRVTADAVETYVPRMDGKKFLGAFEIYYDITDRKEKFDKLLSLSSIVLFSVVFGLLFAIFLVWLKENRIIRERRQVEKALLESEKRYRMLFEKAGDAIFVMKAGGSESGKVLAANQAAADMHGYEIEELLMLNIADLNPPDSEKETLRRVEQILDGDWIKSEITHLKKDSIFAVEISAGLLELESRKFILAFYRDISERKQAESALRESEEKLAGILNSVADLILVVDRDYKIIWSNHVAVEFFDTDLIGKLYYEVFNSRNMTGNSGGLEICFENGSSVENEIEIIRPNGTRLDLWYTASVAAKSEDGVPKSVIVVFRDITEKKLIQAETARTGQLASIGELAAGVAHEINNPINGIINCAQLLIDESPENRTQAEISDRIIKAGSRIAMIVRNLLSFSRNHKDEPYLVHLQSILSDSLDLTETQIRKDGIDLRINIPVEIPMVKVCSHQIQQVFLNIISNARYALNQKFPTQNNYKVFSIDGEVVKINNREYARVKFRDSGTGIPADILDRICDPFFSTKPLGEGTGLGLSISHSIIKDHGGRLNFDSVEGDYANITIDLPVPGGGQFGI